MSTSALASLRALLQRRSRAKIASWGEPVIKDRDMTAIARLFRVDGAVGAVGDRTWSDLSMDAVFARLDRCVTSVGEQVLYRRLRQPSLHPSEIEAWGRRVDVFGENAAARDDVLAALEPLADAHRALDLAPLLHRSPPRTPSVARLAPAATAATLIAGALAWVWPIALVVVIALVFGSIALRLSIHHEMSLYGGAFDAIARLIRAADRLAAIRSDTLAPDLTEVRRLLATIGPDRAALGWLTTRGRSNEIVDSILAYADIVLLLDVNAYVRALDLLRHRQAALAALFARVGEIDAARSIASFCAGVPTARPTLRRRGAPITIDGLRHPLVDDAVPNDVELAESWLVLGSNMSGKSTFIKALAINAVLAQSIGCVTCARYEAPPLVVQSLIHVVDDVARGRSHFLVEAEAARELLVSADGGTDRLYVIDELFRGTNTVDRIAAGAALLRALDRNGARVVAATHDAELGQELPHFRRHYFTERIENGTLTFDYRLREGDLAPRNALAVLELAGFPADVLEDARRLAAS